MHRFEMGTLPSSGNLYVKHHAVTIPHSNGECVNDSGKLHRIQRGMPRRDEVQLDSLLRCIRMMKSGEIKRISSSGS